MTSEETARQDLAARLYHDAEFQRLQAERQRWSWALAVLMLVAFVSYILLIAFQPQMLAIPLSENSVITWGIPAGVGVIVLGFILTGLFVYRSNNKFDQRLKQIMSRMHSADEV